VDEFVIAFIIKPLVLRWNVACAVFDRHVIDGMVNSTGRVTKRVAFGSGWFDRNIVDGLVNFMAFVTQFLGAISRILQTGFLHHYVSFLAAAVMFGFGIFYLFL
jgi:NADH-quinone oxidoreductase subunit L